VVSAQEVPPGADEPEPAATAGDAPAEAPSPALEEAMRRFADAERRFEAGDAGAAIAELRRVYELLEGHPNQHFVLYNLGRAQESLRRYDLALASYREYLEAAPADAPNRADVTASLRALERLLGAVELTLDGDDAPASAAVWVGE
jgi:tetratricopeptide (TPR) repeat protein